MVITIPVSSSATATTRFNKQLSQLSISSTLKKLHSQTPIRFSLSPSPMENLQSTATANQSIVVMRHGDRLDNFEPLWLSSASRPWDPPLYESGLSRAFCTGRKLRNLLGFPIHRVFVSPFLRCVQTAAEAVAGLCAVADDPSALTSRDVAVDPTKLRASIELGLCEMLNNQAIRPISAPKDGRFSFDVSELESLLPSGIVDRSVEPVFTELPKWPEKMEVARNRYVQVIKALADKYPNENLLLVTHGEGVGAAISAFMDGVMVYEVEYCAYVVLKRPVFSREESMNLGEFEVDQTGRGLTGIRYVPLSRSESSE